MPVHLIALTLCRLQVFYDAALFLEKNRDTLSRNVMQLLNSVGNQLVSDLFANKVDPEQESVRSRSKTVKSSDNLKLSVSANFKGSLNDLMMKMLAATPHFIRYDCAFV